MDKRMCRLVPRHLASFACRQFLLPSFSEPQHRDITYPILLIPRYSNNNNSIDDINSIDDNDDDDNNNNNNILYINNNNIL